MSKPEDISQEAWSIASKVGQADCGCAPGRRRVNGTSHANDCWERVEAIARAILSAEKRGEEREREACAEAGADACEQFVRYKIGSAWSDEAGNAVEAAIRKRGA